MSNKSIGNAFEEEFCEILYKHGFWVHRLVQNATGQPADVIAVKNENAYLIDCKVCSRGKFPLSRVEENQHLSMELWMDCNNSEPLFALKIGDDIVMIPYSVMIDQTYCTSSLSETDIMDLGILLERWITSAS